MPGIPSANLDAATVEGFGREWQAYDQSAMSEEEHGRLFASYFSIFPWDALPPNAEGFDLGCGSGRWAAGVAPRVALLHCIDPAPAALAVAKRRLGDQPGVRFHLAAADTIPLADDSQDFGYSLGVLHHIPDPRAALRDCVRKLRPDAPFLLYLYYSLDNRPGWFRAIWKLSNGPRQVISRLPFALRKATTNMIATLVYWPLAKIALAAGKLGADVSNLPLSAYRHHGFYTMRTDALDRFGTRLEQRFSRAQIEEMMREAGLTEIRFREDVPYWVAVGRRRS